MLEAGPLAAERALRILGQIGEALDYAHALGIVHRDIKPSNILVTPDDHAVLIDFGLVEMAESSLLTPMVRCWARRTISRPSRPTGAAPTPLATSMGWRQSPTRCSPAYRPSTAAALRRWSTRISHELPPPPSERRPSLPAAVDPVLLRALGKTPHERYPSLHTFVTELRQALAAPAAQPRPARRWHWLDLAGGLALALLVLLALLLQGRIGGSPQPADSGSAARSGVPLPQRIVWRQGFRLNGEAAPVSLDDTLVVDTLDGALVALNTDTGAIRWQSAARRRAREHLRRAGGRLGPDLLLARSTRRCWGSRSRAAG